MKQEWLLKNIWTIQDMKNVILEAARTRREYCEENEYDPYRELARCISYLTDIGEIQWRQTSSTHNAYVDTFFIVDTTDFRIILTWFDDGWPTLLITADEGLRKEKDIDITMYYIQYHSCHGNFLIDYADYEVEELWPRVQESLQTDYLPPSFSRNVCVIR